MDTTQDTARIRTQEELDRIGAFLKNQQPIGGIEFRDSLQEQVDRGRNSIARLSASADARLTHAECADVICFIGHTEPRELLDPKSSKDVDPYMGFVHVMEAVQEALEEAAASSDGPAEQPRRPDTPFGLPETTSATTTVVTFTQDDKDPDPESVLQSICGLIDCMVENAGECSSESVKRLSSLIYAADLLADPLRDRITLRRVAEEVRS